MNRFKSKRRKFGQALVFGTAFFWSACQSDPDSYHYSITLYNETTSDAYVELGQISQYIKDTAWSDYPFNNVVFSLEQPLEITDFEENFHCTFYLIDSNKYLNINSLEPFIYTNVRFNDFDGLTEYRSWEFTVPQDSL